MGTMVKEDDGRENAQRPCDTAKKHTTTGRKIERSDPKEGDGGHLRESISNRVDVERGERT